MSEHGGRSILFVRHGPGRGRRSEYTRPILDYLSRRVPGLEGRIRIHETGAGGGEGNGGGESDGDESGERTPRLDDVAAVVFWLADPLREHFPDCYAEAVAIADAARTRGLRVVNPPESLSNSVKSVQSRLWQEAGVPTPPCRAFRDHDELRALLPEVEPPYFVRPDRVHTQAGMILVRDAGEARTLRVDDVMCPGVVAPFIDTRRAYRETAPRSIWARLYHKKRALIVADHVRPHHIFFGRHPIVGLSRSTFARYARRGSRYAMLAWLRPLDRAVVAADNAFWQGAAEQPDVMRRAARALGLDIMAIDYSTFADGNVILWEANPYFDLPEWRLGVLPRQRRLRERIEGYYDVLGRTFREWAEAPAPAART